MSLQRVGKQKLIFRDRKKKKFWPGPTQILDFEEIRFQKALKKSSL